jgi:hypothetical protein
MTDTDKRAHVRLSSAKNGDDTTFSRYVKVRGHGKAKPPKHLQHKLPGMSNPSIEAGRSLFHRNGVKPPPVLTRLLVSGHSNVKIGRDARVGKLAGYWIYTLSLEERATCPRTCHHWENCYGNGMPYAKRIDHTHPDFLPRIEAEVDELMRPSAASRKGVIIRLHALGDFYSPEYVALWDALLVKHPELVLFGYTARLLGTPIGDAVERLIDTHPGRAMMRFSNGGLPSRSTVSIVAAEDCPPGAFVCPEQTGQFEACGKCGACWSTLKNVAFLAH